MITVSCSIFDTIVLSIHLVGVLGTIMTHRTLFGLRSHHEDGQTLSMFLFLSFGRSKRQITRNVECTGRNTILVSVC
jgi:hypothetical protein